MNSYVFRNRGSHLSVRQWKSFSSFCDWANMLKNIACQYKLCPTFGQTFFNHLRIFSRHMHMYTHRQKLSNIIFFSETLFWKLQNGICG